MADMVTWKINDQIADLRDGTRGQPNGAVPLDANGKISLSLLKAYATQLPMAQDNPMSLAEYVSRLAIGDVKMPWTWTKSQTPTGFYDFIVYGASYPVAVGTKVCYGNIGFATEVTSIPALTSGQTNDFACTINGVVFIGRPSGLYRSATGASFTKVLNTTITSVAYDGTVYRASHNIPGSSATHLYTSTDGITWTADPTWTESYDSVSKVWYVNNMWFLSGYSAYLGEYYLFRLDNGSWTPLTDMVGTWLDLIYDEANGGFVAISASSVKILYDGQNVWTGLYGLSGSVNCVCSNGELLLIGTSAGAAYYDAQNRTFIPCSAVGETTSWGQVRKIVWANNIFMLAGSELRFSLDGKNCWSVNNTVAQCLYTDIVYGKDYWLVCGSPKNSSLPASSGTYSMKGQTLQLSVYL